MHWTLLDVHFSDLATSALGRECKFVHAGSHRSTNATLSDSNTRSRYHVLFATHLGLLFPNDYSSYSSSSGMSST